MSLTDKQRELIKDLAGKSRCELWEQFRQTVGNDGKYSGELDCVAGELLEKALVAAIPWYSITELTFSRENWNFYVKLRRAWGLSHELWLSFYGVCGVPNSDYQIEPRFQELFRKAVNLEDDELYTLLKQIEDIWPWAKPLYHVLGEKSA